MTPRILLSAFIALCGVSFVAAQDPQKTYDVLLEQVKKSDPKADFLKLRRAYTETAAYNPYEDHAASEKELANEIAAKNYKKAIELADGILKKRFVDAKVHFVAHQAHAALGNTAAAKFHRYAMDGIVKSIFQSGNGKSPATAFEVISTDEENLILGVLGVQRDEQALGQEKGQKFDRIKGTVRFEKGETREVVLFFNVDRPFRWLGNKLKNAPTP